MKKETVENPATPLGAIPSIKYTTKEEIKAALDKAEADLKQLNYEKDQLQEKLYESGVEHRPTIMDQILKKEADARKTIHYIISECEKETGRPFYLDLRYANINSLKLDEFTKATAWAINELNTSCGVKKSLL